MEYYISESNWSTILTFLRNQKGLDTKDTAKLRKFIEAIFYILKTGAQWKYLHKEYGNSKAIHKPVYIYIILFLILIIL
ncbi:transposase [Francisella sp. 19X1-34]|uniref:transposase n=1 Tax=Francisella sp. 19X1-34 TaxID=3087177 RepID=UPI002E325CD4|nr:transposase [Francisella sp. 19X1-34]MED7788819.1 transposase [Francisella sp. 19X1-34]